MTAGAVARIGQLDDATSAKLRAGCNYINAEVEKKRRRVISVTSAAAVLAVLGFIWLLQSGAADPRIAPAVAVVGAAWYVGHATSELARSYKQIVVGRVVSALGNGLKYSPEARLTMQDFLDMDLFEQRAERWHAEDEVAGSKNAVSYSIVEAKATRTEGSGKSRRTVVIFRGLIVRLDFNKYFAGHTVVVPDRESKVLGLIGESQSRGRKEIVTLENAQFEQRFTVYSTDQQQARYLLTPKMMELILEAEALLGSQLRLSFHDNSVFVTVPQTANRFEVRLFGPPVTPESAIGELVEVVRLAERLIDVLDLETRIWTRV